MWAWRVKARRQHREDTSKKDAVERSGAADRGDRRAEAAQTAIERTAQSRNKFLNLFEPPRRHFGRSGLKDRPPHLARPLFDGAPTLGMDSVEIRAHKIHY